MRMDIRLKKELNKLGDAAVNISFEDFSEIQKYVSDGIDVLGTIGCFLSMEVKETEIEDEGNASNNVGVKSGWYMYNLTPNDILVDFSEYYGGKQEKNAKLIIIPGNGFLPKTDFLEYQIEDSKVIRLYDGGMVKDVNADEKEKIEAENKSNNIYSTSEIRNQERDVYSKVPRLNLKDPIERSRKCRFGDMDGDTLSLSEEDLTRLFSLRGSKEFESLFDKHLEEGVKEDVEKIEVKEESTVSCEKSVENNGEVRPVVKYNNHDNVWNHSISDSKPFNNIAEKTPLSKEPVHYYDYFAFFNIDDSKKETLLNLSNEYSSAKTAGKKSAINKKAKEIISFLNKDEQKNVLSRLFCDKNGLYTVTEKYDWEKK